MVKRVKMRGARPNPMKFVQVPKDEDGNILQDDGEGVNHGVEPPDWMSQLARECFIKKVGLYNDRGQDIRGCIEALCQYSVIEADLIAHWSSGWTPTIGSLQMYRSFAQDFYDTPASQLHHLLDNPESNVNPFSRNGVNGKK